MRWTSRVLVLGLACVASGAGASCARDRAAEPAAVESAGLGGEVEREVPREGEAYDAPLRTHAQEDDDDHGAGEFVFAAATTPVRRSVQIGALAPASCLQALKKHKIRYVRAPGAPKIEQPILLRGPIAGVHFDTGRPYAQRSIAAGDAIDCRLAVALVDLAKVVKKHGITTVLVKSFHRPTQTIVDPNAPLRHRIGFAIDIAGFKTKKGAIWNVQHDFHGKIGQVTCGPKAAKPVPDTKVARSLWAVFCDIGATEAFDSAISPNYNQAHFDHLHFDLTADHPLIFYP